MKHQHSRRFIIFENQYGRCDVKWKRSVSVLVLANKRSASVLKSVPWFNSTQHWPSLVRKPKTKILLQPFSEQSGAKRKCPPTSMLIIYWILKLERKFWNMIPPYQMTTPSNTRNTGELRIPNVLRSPPGRIDTVHGTMS